MTRAYYQPLKVKIDHTHKYENERILTPLYSA